MKTYGELREAYPDFYYHGYETEETEESLKVTYQFETAGLSAYTPCWIFPKKKGGDVKAEGNATVQKLLFSLGMVELVSYWKITSSPRVTVRAGALDDKQAAWWKDLYFNGLGEFFYTNGIDADPETFMELRAEGPEAEGEDMPLAKPSGCLVPVGGGKDSAVSIELLRKKGERCTAYIINPRGATVNTVKAGGFAREDVVAVKRTLDRRMLELNARGFLNGHTPFSALVAFSSVIAAYLYGLHCVCLSNESSANESTVKGSTVNHQYSKSFRFEKAFHDYEERYIGSGVYYFSLLRPLTEFQIAKYFAKCTAYHGIFRSCNVGSKEDIWCGHCPKCLFVYLILSPFLSREELKNIFGRDMLEDEEMIPLLRQLTGLEEEKPFECVGSRSEINTAITLAIHRLETAGQELPKLFSYYKNLDLYREYTRLGDTCSSYCDRENLLPEDFMALVERECVSPAGGEPLC